MSAPGVLHDAVVHATPPFMAATCRDKWPCVVVCIPPAFPIIAPLLRLTTTFSRPDLDPVVHPQRSFRGNNITSHKYRYDFRTRSDVLHHGDARTRNGDDELNVSHCDREGPLASSFTSNYISFFNHQKPIVRSIQGRGFYSDVRPLLLMVE